MVQRLLGGKAERLDRALVTRGMMESRTRAQAAIAARLVRVNGVVVTKPGHGVAPEDHLEAEPEHPYVSRGALKLNGALEQFPVRIEDTICLDIGSSTGGFTEVLLERGAARVYAVDVGRGQMHARLRGHPRIVLMEGQDARDLGPQHLPEPPAVIVCDASFISIAKLVGPALTLAADSADLILLFKPQFEVGADSVGKRGIVKDQDAAASAEHDICAWLEGEGWVIRGRADSPITGGDGNRERFIWAARRAPPQYP